MNEEKLREILRLHCLWAMGLGGGVRAYLRGANLRGANLRDINLQGAELRGADLSGADLSRANLSGANLRKANLNDAELRWADLYKADLREASLYGADLYRADLLEAKLHGTDLDYSAWPLHCGSLGAKCDQRLVAQLAYHLASLKPEGVRGWKALRKALKPIANRFHREELPRIK
jgi:hypothetical protein